MKNYNLVFVVMLVMEGVADDGRRLFFLLFFLIIDMKVSL